MFKRRPQFTRLDILSPPSAEIVHAVPDTPHAERAAKRRRVERHAQDYLKGKEVVILSAGLRGPFGAGWVNPWRTISEASEEGRRSYEWERETAARTDVVAESNERQLVIGVSIPTSNRVIDEQKATLKSSDYCHDWLRRQQIRGNTPHLEEDSDIDADLELRTPTKALHGHEQARNRNANLAPAWTASYLTLKPPHLRSEPLNDFSHFESMQVDIGSSLEPRVLRTQNPPSFPKRMLARMDTTDIIDDTTLTKVSLISEDISLPKHRIFESVRVGTKMEVDSPGFVFRRVGKGKRRDSRDADVDHQDSDLRKIATPEPPVIIAEPQQSTVPAVKNLMKNRFLSKEDFDNEAAEEIPEAVTVFTNSDGRWPCPFKDCNNRPKPYASRSGLSGHLKTRHGIHRTTLESTRTAITSKPSSKSTTADAQVSPRRPSLDVVELVDDPIETYSDVDKEKIVALDEENTEYREQSADQVPGVQVEEDPSTATVRAASAEEAPEVSIAPEEVDGVQESNTASAKDDAPNHKASTEVPQPEESSKSDRNPSAPDCSNVETNPPDRQDSKAYSTFNLNAMELSTQAALSQAHRALQETQLPEKGEENAADDLAHSSAEPTALTQSYLETVTPFRKPTKQLNLSQAPDSILRVVPASTQELMNAAEELMFSTVKKPKKKISFADWKVAKPCQPDPSAKLEKYLHSFNSVLHTEQLLSKSFPTSQKHTTYTPDPLQLVSSFSRNRDTTSPTKNYKEAFTFPRSTDHESAIPPVPSYQGGQPRFDSQDIEDALDEAVSFLSTGDVDREIARNSFAKRDLQVR